MECPHCNKESFSSFNIFRSSENIFHCKKCKKKSFFPSEKKFQSNPRLYMFGAIFTIIGIAIPTAVVKFSFLAIAGILLLRASSEKKVYPFESEEELKKLKKLLYDENREIDLRLFNYPKAVTWHENAKNNSSYANKIAELYHNVIKDYEEAEKWYKTAINKNNYDAFENLSTLYLTELKNETIGVAYALALIDIKYSQSDILARLRNKWQIKNETIEDGYYLQLNMPGLPRRFKGDLELLNEPDDLTKYSEENIAETENLDIKWMIISIALLIVIFALLKLLNT